MPNSKRFVPPRHSEYKRFKDLLNRLPVGFYRTTPDGRIRFAWLPTHVPGAAAPLIALDGEPQPVVTLANATAWAQALAGEHPATRTVH